MAIHFLNLKAHKDLQLVWLNIPPLPINQEVERVVEDHLCTTSLRTIPLADPPETYPCQAVLLVDVVLHLVLMVNTHLHLVMMFALLILVVVVHRLPQSELK
jgi:hypothetical protein